MSKPSPIEYKLKKWSITYNPLGHHEKYTAQVVWAAPNADDVKHVYHHKDFFTADFSMRWIEQETGEKYD